MNQYSVRQYSPLSKGNRSTLGASQALYFGVSDEHNSNKSLIAVNKCVPILKSFFSGALFSAIASVEVLCSVVASVLFNSVYSATIDWHPGFCFFVMATVLIIPISISL